MHSPVAYARTGPSTKSIGPGDFLEGPNLEDKQRLGKTCPSWLAIKPTFSRDAVDYRSTGADSWRAQPSNRSEWVPVRTRRSSSPRTWWIASQSISHTTKGREQADRKGITIIELLRKFPDDTVAKKWFERIRCKHGPISPDCGSPNHSLRPSRPSMPDTCKDCRKRFSVRKGSVMQSSKLGNQAWAVAFYMAASNLKGISSLKLHRELETAQRAAWHMPQRIREVFRDGEGTLRGVGESDEVYMGGKDHNRHESRKLEAGRGTVGQTAVVGAQERGGPA